MTDLQPPIRLEVDYAPNHNRWSILARAFLAIPAYILVALLVVPLWPQPNSPFDWVLVAFGLGGGPGFLFVLSFATATLITIRRRYPRWWFEAHAEIVRLGVRFLAYVALLTDRYPPTDREYEVRVFIDPPPIDSPRDRRIALVKWALVAPHLVLLYLLFAVAEVALFVVWVMLLLGRPYPRNVFAFIVYLTGWWLRIYAYAFLHLTDEYPKFGLHRPGAEVIDPTTGRAIWDDRPPDPTESTT